MPEAEKRTATREEVDDESRRVRRLRVVVNLALNLIAQGQMPIEEAQDLAEATRRVALTLFPDKAETYDLLYRPKFRRLITEVYRLQ